jgi:hypothetical protein
MGFTTWKLESRKGIWKIVIGNWRNDGTCRATLQELKVENQEPKQKTENRLLYPEAEDRVPAVLN